MENDIWKIPSSNHARKEYESFFEFWKDAEADLPVIIEAKKAYEKLR